MTNDPTAGRLVPHPMQLEFRLSQGQFTNNPGMVRGTYPKLWAAHETEGQLIVAGSMRSNLKGQQTVRTSNLQI